MRRKASRPLVWGISPLTKPRSASRAQATGKKAVTSFAERVIDAIKSIPRGKVATYGMIAALAGNYRGVRGVVWILHSSSTKHDLPWHRVVNRKGKISLRKNEGYERQKQLLSREGIKFDRSDAIDLKRCLWEPDMDRIDEF